LNRISINNYEKKTPKKLLIFLLKKSVGFRAFFFFFLEVLGNARGLRHSQNNGPPRPSEIDDGPLILGMPRPKGVAQHKARSLKAAKHLLMSDEEV
jgi:hypothetical protein